MHILYNSGMWSEEDILGGYNGSHVNVRPTRIVYRSLDTCAILSHVFAISEIEDQVFYIVCRKNGLSPSIPRYQDIMAALFATDTNRFSLHPII